MNYCGKNIELLILGYFSGHYIGIIPELLQERKESRNYFLLGNTLPLILCFRGRQGRRVNVESLIFIGEGSCNKIFNLFIDWIIGVDQSIGLSHFDRCLAKTFNPILIEQTEPCIKNLLIYINVSFLVVFFRLTKLNFL